MNYNGKEIPVASEEKYAITNEPRRMLVATVTEDAMCESHEAMVIGYVNGVWLALNKDGHGVCEYDYAAEIPTAKVHPFTSAEELDKAIAEHGQWLIGVHSGARYLIISYGNSSVRVDGEGYTMMSMMKDFTFLDGSPCGVLEEDA